MHALRESYIHDESELGMYPDLHAEVASLTYDRWAMGYSDIHGAAFCLDPKNLDNKHHMLQPKDQQEVTMGLKAMCNKILDTNQQVIMALAEFATIEQMRGASDVNKWGVYVAAVTGATSACLVATYGVDMPHLWAVAVN
jgi:hypothetical protein